MEKLQDTTLLRIFEFAFEQKETGKDPEGYRNFFKVIAESARTPKKHLDVLKEISEEYRADKEPTTRQRLISNLQKQRRTINKTLRVVYGKDTVKICNVRSTKWRLSIADKFRQKLQGKSATELDTILRSWQKTKGESEYKFNIIKHNSKIEDHLQKVPNSQLIESFHLTRNQIILRIHEEYALEIDTKTRTALDSLNVLRQSQGLIENYPAKRFRLICPPTTSDSEVILDLAPINFACFVMLRDPNVPSAVKEHIANRINDIACRIRQTHKTSHRILNAYNPVPLGVQFVILTKDGRTLLRKRGKSVLVSEMAWSMSFGGHCGDKDKVDSEFDLGLTAEHELRREIGTLSADPRDIIFTGLHCNTLTGSINILGFWKTEDGTDELVKLLNDEYPGAMKIFETTKRTEELFVLDSKNMIVNFQVSDISKALKKIKSLGGALIPECFVALILALEANGQSTSELFNSM